MSAALSRENPTLLKEYRLHYQSIDRRQLITGILIWMVSFLMFGYSDYLQLGISQTFGMLIIIRVLYAAFCLAALYVLNRTYGDIRAFDAVALAWAVVTVVMDVGIGLLRPREDISVLINDLVGVFSFYIFITSSIRARVIPAALLSAANIAIALFYKVNVPQQEVLSLAFTFIITNVVGTIFSRQYFDLRLNDFRGRMDERRIHNEMKRIASTDSLTGVYNRRRLLELAGEAFYRFRRYGRPFSILVMDLDGFKAVNDTFGHQQGDAVLVDFARSVNSEKREGDALGRMGGDEFCLVLPETTTEEATVLANRIIQTCGDIQVADTENSVSVTTSIGISQAMPPDISLDSLFARADAALYRAKHFGRNRFEIV